MDKHLEDKFYEIACDEVIKKNMSKSAWGRAFSESKGDIQLASALYIEIRVGQLRRDHEEETQRRIEERIRREQIEERIRREQEARRQEEEKRQDPEAIVRQCPKDGSRYNKSFEVCLYCGTRLTRI